MSQSASETITRQATPSDAAHRARLMAICLGLLASCSVVWGIKQAGWQPAGALFMQSAATQDLPLPNGPSPIVWQEGNRLFQAVHEISVWQPAEHAWDPISPNLTEADIPGASGQGIDGITSLAHASGQWYVGTLAGEVTVRHGDGTWHVVRGMLPDRTVTAVSICPYTGGRVATVGYGGYASATPRHPGHLYLTQDSGASWTDITENLPNAPIAALRYAPVRRGVQLLAEVDHHWYYRLPSGRWASV